MVDVDARLAEIAAMTERPGHKRYWGSYANDAIVWLLAVLKEQADRIERLQREATETVARSGGEPNV